MSAHAALKPSRRAVFLDRDGVLNRASVRDGRPHPPETLEEFEILPGVPEALKRLHDAGFLLIGATNQPDVARGTQGREVVEAMNARLLKQLPITAILVCYEDGDDCPRRKPNPGYCSRPPTSRDRPGGQLHGRRPLAGRRGRPPRRVPNGLHRPRIHRAPARPRSRSRCRPVSPALPIWILSQTHNGA